MVVSHKHRFVFLHNPKAAGSAVWRWLCKYYGARRHGKPHCAIVPPDVTGYFTFAVVRNPYSRVVSMWWYWCQDGAYRTDKSAEYMGWNFASWVEACEAKALDVLKIMGQAKFLSHARIDMCLRFEDLPNCLSSLPFVDQPQRLPRIEAHTGNRQPVDRYYSSDLRARVRNLYARDFIAFGYDPSAPCQS